MKNISVTEHYLGKGGKVFGPFTQAQLRQLQATGEIERYSYLWDPQSRSWKAIEAPPPAPDAQIASDEDWSWERLEAICYDQLDLVSGRLSGITQTGCLLETSYRALNWSQQHAVALDLYDPVAKKSRCIRTEILNITPAANGAWVYRLRWVENPLS